MNPSVDRLIEFVAVTDEGSISAAARVIGLPRATLSRRLTSLEDDLGVRLVHRGTRRLVLTAAGQELYQRARRVIADAEAAWDAVKRLDDVPRGLLRVSLPPGDRFSQLLIDYVRDFPEVQLEVTMTTKHVDLVAEGVDVALRFGTVTDTALIARRLWTSRTVAVATPEYLQKHGRPTTAEELTNHQCLMGFAGGWRPAKAWPLQNGGQIEVSGRLVSNEILLINDAVLQGLGIALLPKMLIQPYLDDGTLEWVLQDEVGRQTTGSVVYPEREFMAPAARELVNRMVAEINMDSDLTRRPSIT
jgi:DNA-binding transcriptional LysR family regulator